MGKRQNYDLILQDQKKYPVLTNLLGGYLHQDAAIISGSFDAAVDALVEDALLDKATIYRELKELIAGFQVDQDAERFFSRHIQWIIEGDHKEWFVSLLEKIRDTERRKY